MSEKSLILMRGLPSCGKSHTARRLCGDTGVVLETDEYFYSQVGDDVAKYDYREDLLPRARQWNLNRCRMAIRQSISPIIIDRGNGANAATYQYARLAVDTGYRVELCEPESPWWQEIRVLLKYKDTTRAILYEWAEVLAEKSRATHRVPVEVIRRWMDAWCWDLTVDDILRCSPDHE